MEYETIRHTFPPVWDERSRILILGTFPSVKSRENHFYYGHPQNRFWKVIAGITGGAVPETVSVVPKTVSVVPETIEEKKELLLANRIAIWDVIASCRIMGSSDSSIRDVEANDIPSLLEKTNISSIYGNGAKACELYDRYVYDQTGIAISRLPSTSPANAAYRLEQLIAEWQKILS